MSLEEAKAGLRVRVKVAGRVTLILLRNINRSYGALGMSRVRQLWLKSAM